MHLSREEMDRVVDEHFGFEAADDVDGVMASLAPEVEHEVVPSPVGVLRDREKVRAYYDSVLKTMNDQVVLKRK